MADDENETHKSQYYMQVKQKLLDVSMHFIGWYKAVKNKFYWSAMSCDQNEDY